MSKTTALLSFTPRERRTQEECAIVLWRRLAEDYRIKVIRYRFLLATKKELRIKPYKPVPEPDIRRYPDIPFLRILGEAEAAEFLHNLPDHQLMALIREIEDMVAFDNVFRTLSARNLDYEWEIGHHGKPRPRKGGALDPDFHTPRCGVRRKSRTGQYE